MRIAVITFFQSQDNYGQILQCYALQQTLKSMGHKPYVIRYGFHKKYFHWIKKENFSSIAGIKAFLHNLIQILSPNQKSPRDFNSFKNSRIKQSFRSYNSLIELQKHPPKADCYITGSDQVWAQLLSIRDNRSFFLDFGPSNVRRIAYAPSFALNEYPAEIKKNLNAQLYEFDAISVREYSGVKICKSVGFDASLVLDPTLLLSASIYKRLAIRPSTSHYCFVYHVNVTSKDELIWERISQFNKTNGLSSIATYANPKYGMKMDFLENAHYVYPTIEEWLGYICFSEYVLTSSYHGMIFSILFHKSFVICLREDSQFAGNDRIMTLLKILHLEDRIADRANVEDIISTPINWDAIDSTLNINKEESLDYLRRSLAK